MSRITVTGELPPHLKGQKITLDYEELTPSTIREIIESLEDTAALFNEPTDPRVPGLKALWDHLTG